MRTFYLIIITSFLVQYGTTAQEGWRKLGSGLMGTAFAGWTKVNGDTSTFYWNTKPVEKYTGDPSVIQEDVYTFDDYRVTIDTSSSGGLYARWYDLFTGTAYDTTFHLPLKVDIVTDPNNPIDVSDNTWLMEFAVEAPWNYRQFYYSQLGWDLVPGGLAYTQGSPGFYERYIDILNFERYDINPATGDTTFTGLLLQTNHQPDTYINAYGDTVHINATAPSHGDEFTIKTLNPKNLNSVNFISKDVGWAAGGNTTEDSSNGYIVYTSDEGRNWRPQIVPPYEITSVCFTSEDSGWASTIRSIGLQDKCVILKTTNRGENWVIKSELISQDLFDIYFIDSNTGWTVGSNGLIEKSADGGDNWISEQSGTNVNLRSISFIDYNTGWVTGDGGVIVHTTDGGENWEMQVSGTDKNLRSVQFVNQDIGWTVGDSSTIIKTTDGGINWIDKGISDYSFTSVDFIDGLTGWVAGNSDNNTSGAIYNTVDGGDNWILQATTKHLEAIQILDDYSGWAVGDSSSIYHTTNGGVSSFEEEESPVVLSEYKLSANYPNPFNPSTKIRWISPSGSWQKIIIYDVLGNEVAVLVDDYKPAGTYEIEWIAVGFASGVYFYQLRAGDFIETKKMILMK